MAKRKPRRPAAPKKGAAKCTKAQIRSRTRPPERAGDLRPRRGSANEQLEPGKEEPQSLNELQHKIAELEPANNDLNNLLASADVPTLFLDRELRIRRFTLAAGKMLRLIGADVGRPIAEFAEALRGADLARDAASVLERLTPVTDEVETGDGRWSICRVLPYRTEDKRIDGVVVTFTDISERKQTEQALQRLAAIVESSQDAIIGKTLDGTITSWNRGAERMYGYKPDEVIGRSIDVIIPPERSGELAEIFARIGRGEHVEHFETLRLRKNGELLHVSVAVSPLRDAAGKVVGASAIARDISERKLRDKKLRTRERQLRALADALPVLISYVDTGQCYRYVNATYENWLCRPRQELIGKTLRELIGDAAYEIALPHLEAALAGETRTHEYSLTHPSLGVRAIEASYFPDIAADGRVRGIYVLALDITTRQEATQKLEAAAEMLEQRVAQRTSILNLLHAIASAANKADTFEEAVAFVLRRVSEHNGWSFGHAFVPVEDTPDELRALNVYYEEAPGRFAPLRTATLKTTIGRGQGLPGQAYASGKPVWTNDVPADLEARRAQLAEALDVATGMAFPVVIGSEVIGVLEFFADDRFTPEKATLDTMANVGVQLGFVAERIRLRRHEAELAHASRVSALGELVASLTHQLGQPLAAIANYVGGAVRRLQSRPDVDPRVLERLKQAAELTQQAAGVVNTVRDFVRKKDVALNPLDMNALVHRTVGLLAAEARHRRTEVKLELAAELPPVRGAGVQLEQVLLNLMMNGIDAMQSEPGTRTLTVRTFKNEKREVETTVSDTGMGVPSEITARMFEPFVSTKPEGLGMGLTVARSIVETHHGRLWAEHHSDGGMTFHLGLPIADGEPQ